MDTDLLGLSKVCVAKYEMKKGPAGEAVSLADGQPWTNILRSDAIAACKKNGERYDLISNSLWTFMARKVASYGENWSSSVEHVGRLNIGNAGKIANQALPASQNDNDSCFQTGQKCSLSEWSFARRTHSLPSGEIFWDLSGNVSEWVTETLGDLAVLKSSPLSLLDFAKEPYSKFGPLVNCDNPLIENTHCGFGSLQIPRNAKERPLKVGIARGGHWEQEIIVPGIFSTALGLAIIKQEENPQLGFRCIYLPNK